MKTTPLLPTVLPLPLLAAGLASRCSTAAAPGGTGVPGGASTPTVAVQR